jgi:hypothetical protein
MTDLLILLAAMGLTLATWAWLSDNTGVPVWKSYTTVTITLLLALAALTRNPNWAAAIRVLTGLWLIAAPFLLTFQDVTPARWTYIGIGAIVTAVAVPALAARRTNPVPMTV